MTSGIKTEVVSIKNNDVRLADAITPRDAEGAIHLKRGGCGFMVRVVDMSDPFSPDDCQARPNFRLETLEKMDTNSPNGRSFGEDERLIIASRSMAPRFKILLLPKRAGDPLPTTTINKVHSRLSIVLGDYTDSFDFSVGNDGRNPHRRESPRTESAHAAMALPPAPANDRSLTMRKETPWSDNSTCFSLSLARVE